MINGLRYVPDYLTSEEQNNLLNEIDSYPWLNELKRRTQHYGFKYDYTKKSINQNMKVGPFPELCRKLAERLYNDIIPKLPDQLIINEYLPGQGIAPHVDCVPCFGDAICSISLGDVYQMDFSNSQDKFSLDLELGSLLILSGEARYSWRHGIAARLRDGDRERKRRVSLTYRKVILED